MGGDAIQGLPAERELKVGLLAISNGLKVGELAMHEVDDGDEVAGGAGAADAGLGGLDQGG